jgi:hypothetical protein
MKAWMYDRKEATAKKPLAIIDPTECCPMLITLKSDGSLKEPKHITPIIAKLDYCMRFIFLWESELGWTSKMTVTTTSWRGWRWRRA